MNSYQRLKQENETLKEQAKILEILIDKDYYIRKIAERISQMALIEVETRYIAFVIPSPNGVFMECRIDKNLHINTAKVNGVNLF